MVAGTGSSERPATVSIERETIHAALDGQVAAVVLNRPDVLNCLDERVVDDFHAIADRLEGCDALRVVIVRGAGRAFCSGIDLTALSENRISSRFFRRWETALRRLELMSPLVIAAVHSHCIGGGLQLALACDLRVAREDARFGLTAVKEGIIPGMGMWRLTRHAGVGRAKRLALAAEIVDAHTACQWGIVDYVADGESFEAQIQALTGRLLDMSWTSVSLTKKLTNESFDLPFDECLERFCVAQGTATDSSEHRVAMAERRAARVRRRVLDERG